MHKGFPAKTGVLTFEFASPEAATHFKLWLCESGEQDYWNWMEYREQEEEGDITGLDFDYMKNDKVKVTCGRQDWEESTTRSR